MRIRYRFNKDGVGQYIGNRDKSISVRLPLRIYYIVMEYEGKTFTDKLINLIFDYKEFHDLKR